MSMYLIVKGDTTVDSIEKSYALYPQAIMNFVGSFPYNANNN